MDWNEDSWTTRVMFEDVFRDVVYRFVCCMNCDVNKGIRRIIYQGGIQWYVIELRKM